MLGWGSWANTLKMTSKSWEFPLYYWDYSIGLVLTTLIFGFTFGSNGDEGRSFVNDLSQAETSALTSAFVGGVIFNLSNLLIVAATAIAGMSVAFPIAVGLALAIGVVVNYIATPVGNPYLLFLGLALVVAAILVDAAAYKKLPQENKGDQKKGIIISIISGILMGFFYRFVAASMTTNFATPDVGLLTPYSAMFVFTIGIFLSNFVFNTWFMYKPVSGKPVGYGDYFKLGTPKMHMIGLLGGLIWCAAMEFNLMASEKAGFAISYGLGQGATMISAAWGVFVWKEFAGAPKGTNKLLTAMFILFIIGLALLVIARLN
ncbi:MAG: multidrug DMT transporter permease [Cyclobacteriaceae bacterium]|nr:multidrug DMT transporter permease [Cyclobacteriaceae bacterium]